MTQKKNPASNADRQPQDEEVRPRDGAVFTVTITPLQAAWTYGRLINQLEHRLQVAWLTQDSGENSRVEPLWLELRLSTRELFADAG
jgi:hypothetical protein